MNKDDKYPVAINGKLVTERGNETPAKFTFEEFVYWSRRTARLVPTVKVVIHLSRKAN